MSTNQPLAEQPTGGERKKQRRSRSRQPGSSQEYQTENGKRWRFHIYVSKNPKYPELGNRRLTRSGFLTTGKADNALQEACKQLRQNEKSSEKVLASYKVVRAELSFALAKTDAYVFGDDDGKLRSSDAMTSRWARRMKWLAKIHMTLPRVTIKGLHHTHATLLLELDEHPKVVQERLGHSTITTTLNIHSHVTEGTMWAGDKAWTWCLYLGFWLLGGGKAVGFMVMGA